MKKYVLISLIVHLAILFLFATIKTDEVEKEKLVKNADVSIDDQNIKLSTSFKDESEKELSSLEMKLKIDKFLLDKDLLKSLAKNNEKLEFSCLIYFIAERGL